DGNGARGRSGHGDLLRESDALNGTYDRVVVPGEHVLRLPVVAEQPFPAARDLARSAAAVSRTAAPAGDAAFPFVAFRPRGPELSRGLVPVVAARVAGVLAVAVFPCRFAVFLGAAVFSPDFVLGVAGPAERVWAFPLVFPAPVVVGSREGLQ